MKISFSPQQKTQNNSNKPAKVTFKEIVELPKYQIKKMLEEHRVQDSRPVSSYNPKGKTLDVAMNDVVVSPNQMITAGVNTCSTVRTTYKGQNLLGHIGIYTPTETIKNKFKELGVKEFREDPNARISVKSGHDSESFYTTGIILSALTDLGLENKIQYDGKVEDGMTEVGVNNNGFFEQQYGTLAVNNARRTLYASPHGVVTTELPQQPIALNYNQIALPASTRK